MGPKRAILVPSGVDGVRRLTLTRLPNPRGVKEVRYADTDGQCQQEPVSGLERSPGPGRGPCQAGQSRDQNAPDTLHVGESHGEKAYSHRIRMEYRTRIVKYEYSYCKVLATIPTVLLYLLRYLQYCGCNQCLPEVG